VRITVTPTNVFANKSLSSTSEAFVQHPNIIDGSAVKSQNIVSLWDQNLLIATKCRELKQTALEAREIGLSWRTDVVTLNGHCVKWMDMSQGTALLLRKLSGDGNVKRWLCVGLQTVDNGLIFIWHKMCVMNVFYDIKEWERKWREIDSLDRNK
jgi:hypothetical protein